MKGPFICALRLTLLITLSGSVPVFAAEVSQLEPGVLATRGEGVLTQEVFDAHADRIPAENRLRLLRDKDRLEEIMNQLLISDQLASAAEDAGFEADPMVVARMQLAAREELARAWLEHYVRGLSQPDYELMAREYWQVNRSEFQTIPTVDVTHILISTAERDDTAALELATGLHERLIKDPSGFDAMVIEYSEDPSAAANKGRFYGVKKGEMTRAFEDMAFSLDAGQISGPVKTPYGYHLIRLDGKKPAEVKPFREVRQELVMKMRAEHRREAQNNYLTQLYSEDASISIEAMQEMVERQFGESTAGQAPEPRSGE